MADMEPTPLNGDMPQEEVTETSPEQDLETLMEAESIKSDPTRMDAVRALAKEQGVPIPGEPEVKSFKATVKGMGAGLVDGLGKG